MKKSAKIITSICALSAGAVMATEAIWSPAGTITINEPHCVFAPKLFGKGWVGVSAVPETGKQSDATQSGAAASATRAFSLAVPNGPKIRGSLECSEAGAETLAARYHFRADEDTQVETVYVGTAFDIATLAGGTWKTDNGSGTFSAVFSETNIHLFGGRTKSLILEGANPEKFTLAIFFEEPTQILIQDDRKWGETFSVRIQAGRQNLVKDEEFEINFVVGTTTPLTLIEDKPQTIAAGKDWVPIVVENEIVAGSALDFSNLIPWHSPAGKFGRVKAVGEHFVFERKPDEPQRFYGVNLCFSANFLTDEQAETLAERFRKIGYNALRLHHHDGGCVEGSADGTTLNAAQMAKLDALVAACIKRGIYVTTDLYVSRRVPWREIGIDRDGTIPQNEFKMLVAVNDKAMENWKQFARNFLTHVNPHTGRAYAHEPALAWLAMVNEGNFGNYLGTQKQIPEFAEKWKTWLAKKQAEDKAFVGIPDTLPDNIYHTSPHVSAYSVFMRELEAEMFAEMKRFVRDELGCNALVSNYNGWVHKTCDQITREDLYDYVDDHFYEDHPRFLEKSWQLPSWCDNKNTFRNSALGMRSLAFVRHFGKPFTVSEFNYSAPGRYRGVGGIATGSIAALQDWSVLWRFAYSHDNHGMFKPSRLSYFDVSRDPLMLASERASMCLFLRRDITPLKRTLSLEIPRTLADTPDEKLGVPPLVPTYLDVAWRVRVGTVIDKATKKNDYVLPFDMAYNIDNSFAIRDKVKGEPFGGGAIAIDKDKGSFVITTPRTVGGFTEQGRIDADCLRFDLPDTPATVWLSSLDEAPCVSSRRLILTHLTDVQNTGARYAEYSRQTLLAWGDIPHLAQVGTAEIAIKFDAPKRYKVYALSTSGQRLREIKTTVRDGRLCFTANNAADPASAQIVYEIVAE